MSDAEIIENLVMQMDLPYEELGEGIWVIKDQEETIHNVITLSGPVVVMRIKIVDVPESGAEALFRLLLELNATELLHGAYGLEDKEAVMVEVMSLQHLNFPTFQEAVESMFMAVTTHHPIIARLLMGNSAPAGKEAR